MLPSTLASVDKQRNASPIINNKKKSKSIML
jgi:hypothetical protein